MIPRQVRRFIEEALASRAPRSVDSGRVVVLCYHSVAPEGRASTHPGAFAEQMRWLSEHADVVPFALIEPTPSGSGERPRVAITFDDGYADNYTHAFPILTDLGLRATFFLATGLLDADRETIDRLARVWGTSPDDVAGLTWEQVDEMRALGMEFGAHTHSHPNLARVGDARARSEAVRSKDRLEERLGEEVAIFAYPFGDVRFDFTPSTMRMLRAAGFRSAASIQFRGVRPSDDPMALPRFPVLNDTMELLHAKVDGRLDAVGLFREHAPLWLSGLISSGRRRAKNAA